MTATATAREPGLYPDIPETEYHADQSSLSHSGAKTILKSPAHFKWEREHPVFKDVYDFGSAAHALALGAGMENIYVAPFESWQSKVAQAERDLAREAGLSPILPKQWLTVCDMADQLKTHPKAMRLLTGGRPEVSVYDVNAETGVTRRCRFDYLHDDLGVDYKTADSADPRDFARSAANYGYHMQHAWYVDVAEGAGINLRGFVFVVQEKTAPFLVSVVELVPDAVQLGRGRNRLALQRFRDCTESGYWPGYGEDITPIDVPQWAYYQETST